METPNYQEHYRVAKVYGWCLMILNNYFYKIPGAFTAEECDQFHELARHIQLGTGKVGLGKHDPDMKDEEDLVDFRSRKSVTGWFEPAKLPEHLMGKIVEMTNLANHEGGWNFDLCYQENLQYTIYNGAPVGEKGGYYHWHADHGGEVGDDGRHRKLSWVIQLTDPQEYEGGNFQFIEPWKQFWDLGREGGRKEFDLDSMIATVPWSCKAKGTFLAFPSFLFHQVTPVLAGTRISLVGWVQGFPYR